MTVKEIIKKDPNGLIAQAYEFSKKAHAGQKRKTGEPFFVHPLAVAETLASWNMDEETIAAGLLHDIIEDTKTGKEELAKQFGETIVFLVDGVSKLGKIKYQGVASKISANAKIENLRKMILALSEDLRVVFVKLADRLNNMRTLGALPPVKQKRIALETEEIYAALTYRLGMQNLSGELHDLAFPYLYPKEHDWLLKHIPEKYEERRRYLERLEPRIKAALEKHGLEWSAIDFRAKRYSSLYKKLTRHNMDIDKIYDLVAMRIIFKNVADCYAALGVIHELFPPLPGRIKDYIAMPKPNGYRSLHTTVITEANKFVEFQIRTEEMHREDEEGVAAHWLYEQRKEGGKNYRNIQFVKEFHWVEQLRNWQEKYDNSMTDPEAFLHAMKVDFFKDRIFVITPKGEVLDLPVDSTPVDFAYHIHTTIGNTCVGTKVNGSFVPLDHSLHSGDVVEILTQKNKLPSEDWLKFVKTAGARDKIRVAITQKKGSLTSRRVPSGIELKLIIQDRFGLIQEITGAITRSHINIRRLQTIHQSGNQFPSIKLQCQITDKEKINKIILKLKKIKGVREISQTAI
jgi:GTP pyrophosphokinase